jgi:hypothetical protein
MEQAGELFGLPGRHFRRQSVDHDADGVAMLRDKWVGRTSNRRAQESERDRIRRLYRKDYPDFVAKHFHEELRRDHNYAPGYGVTRLVLQSSGEVQPVAGRGKRRNNRARRPLSGMMRFRDGSVHRWIGALGHDVDLIVTVDDATGWIYWFFTVLRGKKRVRLGGRGSSLPPSR